MSSAAVVIGGLRVNDNFAYAQEEIYDLLEKDRCKRLYVKEDPHRGFYVKVHHFY